MPSPISKEMGRKPYINTKGIDGGYVNEMRRTPQSLQEPMPAPLQKRSRGAVIDTRITTTMCMISEYSSESSIWGMTFDKIGGLYAGRSGVDIYYRPAGSAIFGALNQTSRQWDKMECAPNGDIYAIDWYAGIYIRAGGAGDFTLFEAGRWLAPLAADPNGDVYAVKRNLETSRGELYVRASGAASFTLVAGITPPQWLRGLGLRPERGFIYMVIWSGQVRRLCPHWEGWRLRAD